MSQSQISISPNQFAPNQSITLTVTPANGMDFSGVQSSGVAIIPADHIENLQGIPQSNGDLRVDLSILTEAPFGIRTLVIIGPDHLVLTSGIIRVAPH